MSVASRLSDAGLSASCLVGMPQPTSALIARLRTDWSRPANDRQALGTPRNPRAVAAAPPPGAGLSPSISARERSATGSAEACSEAGGEARGHERCLDADLLDRDAGCGGAERGSADDRG
jgi:hypothetical protein